MNVYDNYEMTIGIECHVQLATKSKLFSGADNDARSAEPNSCVSAIDFALPGMLPVLNHEAVMLAVKAGTALGADIARVSRFDRKHYFYPDLPKGYQTSQMYEPIILAGSVSVPMENGHDTQVRIHHAHMEEDAGKLTHYADYSLVDLNRAGTPLIEIVSEPDIHSAAEARAFATELHNLMTYAGVTYGDLFHGNMRFDVNVSVAKKGAAKLGIRAEVKNLNSFRSVEKAAEYEFRRQVDVIESGGEVVQETRGWNDDTQSTASQRSKEDAQDYRYMPDPDIPPIVLTDEEIVEIQAGMAKLPPEYRQEFGQLQVDGSVVAKVMSRQSSAEIVSAVLAEGGVAAARRVANWIASSLLPEEVDVQVRIPGVSDLLTLAEMAEKSEITSNAATELFNVLMNGGSNPRQLAESRNLLQVSDEEAIGVIVDEVLADSGSAKAIADIRAGNDKAIGYLVGQIMKKSQGKANPALAQKLIWEKL